MIVADIQQPGFRPRHYFLNEQHELATLSRDAQGRSPSFAPIDWGQHASKLRTTFAHAATPPMGSPDPTVRGHLFMIAAPAPLVKESKSQKAAATGGKLPFEAQFGGVQSNVLGKLGFDLIGVDGRNATVHVPRQRVPQLQAKLEMLETASRRDKDRWINIGEFLPVDSSNRVSPAWLGEFDEDISIDAHLRFYPVIPRLEFLGVLDMLSGQLAANERLVRKGRDFSGRYWCVARIRKETIVRIARLFPSIQSIHPPLSTALAGQPARRPVRIVPGQLARSVLDVSNLPTIGVLDSGIPENHVALSPYVRGRYLDPELSTVLQAQGHHACGVASALVFGRLHFDRTPDEAEIPQGTCRVFDMLGTWTYKDGEIPDEMMARAIQGVIAIAPDIRVFNLSLGGIPLDRFGEIDRREKLSFLQDLENVAYARDILLVIAAGNSPPGAVPTPPYPRHIDSEAWKLGVLATTFNGLVVGAFVDKLMPRGVTTTPGAPSPFTCIGPGRLRAPVPGFGAPGGDATSDYDPAHGNGIWGLNADGLWQDCTGTSYAAPLVAREAAMAIQELVPYCQGSIPFAATVRALLILLARRPRFTGALEKLAERTLGDGQPFAQRLRTADPERAVFVWQTVLPDPSAVARVSVPVPRAWLATATAPRLRLVVAWLTPVNIALVDSWACRKVSAQLKTRAGGGVTPLRTGPGSKGAYPVSDRTFDISADQLAEQKAVVDSDAWVLEVSYHELGPTPPGMEFSPQQRVGVAVELYDECEKPTSPQLAIQALPIAASMNRLSILGAPLQVPVVVR